MAVEEPLIDETSGLDPLSPVMAQLLRGVCRRALMDLQGELRQGTIDVAEGSRQVAIVHGALEALENAEADLSAESLLVSWVRERGGAR